MSGFSPAPANWSPVEYRRLAPFCWEAAVRVTPHARVVAQGWSRRAARRALSGITQRELT